MRTSPLAVRGRAAAAAATPLRGAPRAAPERAVLARRRSGAAPVVRPRVTPAPGGGAEVANTSPRSATWPADPGAAKRQRRAHSGGGVPSLPSGAPQPPPPAAWRPAPHFVEVTRGAVGAPPQAVNENTRRGSPRAAAAAHLAFSCSILGGVGFQAEAKCASANRGPKPGGPRGTIPVPPTAKLLDGSRVPHPPRFTTRARPSRTRGALHRWAPHGRHRAPRCCRRAHGTRVGPTSRERPLCCIRTALPWRLD